MMVTIKNDQGQVVGFAGRDMSDGSSKLGNTMGRKPAKYGMVTILKILITLCFNYYFMNIDFRV